MIFAVLGGDDRSVRLSRLLMQDGHHVSAFALENALPYSTENVEEVLSDAEGIILPLPCCSGGLLNAPFSGAKHGVAELLLSAAPGAPVFAGKAEPIAGVCAGLNLPLYDYFAREDFAVKNAELTAEGTVELMMRESPGAIRGSRVLICGFGRIGKLLALKLRAMGADVTVAVRRAEDVAWAECFGCKGTDFTCGIKTHRWDFVINTVPATVLSGEHIAAFGSAILIELASPPYGFDFAAAEKIGRRIVLASGLPGKSAPEKAAEIVRDTIYKILEESR